MIVNSLDLFTITVPPALPLVFSSGIGFALAHLRKGGIFCIDAQRINSCGQLDTFYFDTTGTLTEESLQLVGVDVVSRETQALARIDTSDQGCAAAMLLEQFRLAMAACHSLSEVDALQGYSLELSMIAKAEVPLEFGNQSRSVSGATAYLAVAAMASGSDGIDGIGGSTTTTLGMVKRFSLDTACRRSIVVVEKAATKQRFVFVKGPPEAVSAIARDTVVDLAATSLQYAADGNCDISELERPCGRGAGRAVDGHCTLPQRAQARVAPSLSNRFARRHGGPTDCVQRKAIVRGI